MVVTELQVEGFVFPPTVKPPGSSKTLILGGAGVRGVEKEGKYMKFTSIGVYMEEEALPFLAVKWKGRSVDELTDSTEFFMDIITGPFEKLTRVNFILPLTGPSYSGTVSRNCVKYWKAAGIYSEAEETIIEKFKEVFKDQSFQPGAACLFTQSPSGSFTIAFSEDSSIPEEGFAVIENKALSEEVLETIIGEHGVSPTLKRSLTERLSELLKEFEPRKIVEGNGDYEKY